MSFISKFFNKNQASDITLTSIPSQDAATFLVAFAHRPDRLKIAGSVSGDEQVEVLIIYLFAVDIALHFSLKNKPVKAELSEAVINLFISYLRDGAPSISIDQIRRLVLNRFAFYADSYNRMMKPDGNSSQMQLDFLKKIPSLDFFTSMEIYFQFMDILLQTEKFIKDGLPRKVFAETIEAASRGYK